MELLQYTFFQHALIGSLLASIACGLIGTYIVTRRLVFISGGLTHASFGGIGLGLYTGISPILSAALFAVLSAFGVEWLSKRKDMREDSAIAVFWTLGMALASCSLSSRRDSHPTCPPISSATFSRLPGATSLYWEGLPCC